MKIYKAHTLASGVSLVLVNALEVPPGVPRTGFRELPVVGFENSVNGFAKWEQPDGYFGPADKNIVLKNVIPVACVRLEDLAKCKVHKIIGEYAVIDIDLVPVGVERSVPFNEGILGRETMCSSYFLGERGPAAKRNILTLAAVKIDALCAGAWGQYPAARPSGLDMALLQAEKDRRRTTAFDGKTTDECFDIYVKWMHGENPNGGQAHMTRCPLTPTQLLAAKDEWSRRLKAKTTEAKAEAKKIEDALVGWNPYEGDDL